MPPIRWLYYPKNRLKWNALCFSDAIRKNTRTKIGYCSQFYRREHWGSGKLPDFFTAAHGENVIKILWLQEQCGMLLDHFLVLVHGNLEEKGQWGWVRPSEGERSVKMLCRWSPYSALALTCPMTPPYFLWVALGILWKNEYYSSTGFTKPYHRYS